jgi:hypothetical protein
LRVPCLAWLSHASASIVIDRPDPGALATFYGAMLDWKADVSPGWAEVRAEYGQCTSFRVFLDPAGHPFCLCLD